MALINFLIKMLWPYVRTMVLKGQTFKEALKNDKKSLFFALLVMLSFAANAYLMTRIVAISREHVILQEKYSKAIAGSRQNQVHDGKEVKQNKRPPPDASVAPEVVKEEPHEAPVVVTVAKKPSKQRKPKTANEEAAEERYRNLQKRFEDIRRRESHKQETL